MKINWTIFTQLWDLFSHILSNIQRVHQALDQLEAWIDSSTIDEAMGLEPWLENIIHELQKILDKLNTAHAAILQKKDGV